MESNANLAIKIKANLVRILQEISKILSINFLRKLSCSSLARFAFQQNSVIQQVKRSNVQIYTGGEGVPAAVRETAHRRSEGGSEWLL